MTNSIDPRDLIIADLIAERGELVAELDIEPFFPRKPTVRILIVADTNISFVSGFGIGKVIDLIRANVDSYVRFEVDMAYIGVRGSSLIVNSSPAPREAKYVNFRFSSEHEGQQIIDEYDEVWCFGFAPDNSGSADDDRITDHPTAPEPSDLEALTAWMNAGGGVLAMGDHHYLGATMCSQIPRVRHMRRWTNAQSAPPQFGVDRHDTNRPQNAAQDPDVTDPPNTIPNTAERDDVPQPIEWKRYSTASVFVFERRYRPHPVLCGGELGVIDVLPDHPHEGWIYEDGDVELDAEYRYGDESGKDFAEKGGVRPRPEVIAWSDSLGDPPHAFSKGATPARRFGQIGVYDGDEIDYGRIIVDSTWHHWMDLNLNGLESAADDTAFQKIARYFRNCAVWLAREGQRSRMLTYTSWWTVLRAPLFEDLNANRSIFELGGVGLDVIGREASDCFTSEWVYIFVPREVYERLRIPIRPEGPIWALPHPELANQAVLGGILKSMIEVRDQVLEMRDRKAFMEIDLDAQLEKAVFKGAQAGLDAFDQALSENADVLAPVRDRCDFRAMWKDSWSRTRGR